MIQAGLIRKAAGQFLGSEDKVLITPLGQGLIHLTYRVDPPEPGKSILLQALNTRVFPKPADILHNYLAVFNFLEGQQSFHIPAPVKTIEGGLLWVDDAKNSWRATVFMPNTYSPLVAGNAGDAGTVASVFGGFTRCLAKLDIGGLRVILPDFHNLVRRYGDLQKAILSALPARREAASQAIGQALGRENLVNFYASIRQSPEFPDRVTHHDCKISNILFDKSNGQVICPVDLDTVMPGKCFSDLGDMIRSMACSQDENSRELDQLELLPDFYRSIVGGYLDGMGDLLGAAEKKHIHFSGLMMVYMQALRFLEDFLRGDSYYQTSYSDQNLDRALNQLTLLDKLEFFLQQEYQFRG